MLNINCENNKIRNIKIFKEIKILRYNVLKFPPLTSFEFMLFILLRLWLRRILLN